MEKWTALSYGSNIPSGIKGGHNTFIKAELKEISTEEAMRLYDEGKDIAYTSIYMSKPGPGLGIRAGRPFTGNSNREGLVYILHSQNVVLHDYSVYHMEVPTFLLDDFPMYSSPYYLIELAEMRYQ